MDSGSNPGGPIHYVQGPICLLEVPVNFGGLCTPIIPPHFSSDLSPFHKYRIYCYIFGSGFTFTGSYFDPIREIPEVEDLAGPNIGILSLQGDVSEHVDAMERAMDILDIDGEVITVKEQRAFDTVDGVVIPGGESTTIYRLLRNFGLYDLLLERRRKEDLPVFGTCAGMVLLAEEGGEQVGDAGTQLLRLIPARVVRNAFGSQKNSFQALLDIKGFSRPFPGVFIRAPAYGKIWGSAEVLAEIENKIVLARKDKVIGCAFHPELVDDIRVHEMFLRMCL